MQRILSELNFYRARSKTGDKELKLLAESLRQSPGNSNASTRWMKRAGAQAMRDNSSATDTAFANTLMLGLRTLRDHQTVVGADSSDRAFERFVSQNALKSVSQIFQDLWVLFETREKRGGYFVEFGATNGRDISNTLLLEREYGWKGILAEPNPFWHDDLKSSRSAKIETRCVSSKTGDTLELFLTEDPEFASTAADSATVVREATTKKISVDTISLADLLEAHKAPKEIDFLSIDTEGSEFDILNAFDFQGPRKIRLIALEHNFEIEKRQNVFDLLSANGYKRHYQTYSMFDDWYVLQS